MMKQLLEPILDERIQHAHWFNGRLLSAEALQADQMAQRRAREQLGRAIGSGVVYGLTVTHKTAVTAPTLNISQGLALNRLGQAVELREDIELPLGTLPESPAASAGLFAPCKAGSDGDVEAKQGFYLLAAAPTSAYQERVPLHDIHASGLADSCGSRYETAGILLRLVPIDIGNKSLVDEDVQKKLREEIETAKTSADALSRLRNLMAHWCLGTFDTAKITAAPYAHLSAGATNPIGLTDRLRDPNVQLLNDGDVSLALIYWTKDGVQFVDMWAVRRHISHSPTDFAWPFHTDQGQQAIAAARLLQFQQQIADLYANATIKLNTMEAREWFYYLPAAGYLPTAVAALGADGVSADTFFKGLPLVEKRPFDPAFMREITRLSWWQAPLQLKDNPPPVIVHFPPDETALYLLFARAETLPEAESPAVEEDVPESVEPEVRTGSFIVSVSLADRGDVAGAGTSMLLQAIKDREETAVVQGIRRYYSREKKLADVSRSDTASAAYGDTVIDPSHLRAAVYALPVGHTDERNKTYGVYDFRSAPSRVGSLIFRIQDLPPGNYKVVAELTGYVTASEIRQLNRGAEIHVSLKLSKARPPDDPRLPPPKRRHRYFLPPFEEVVVIPQEIYPPPEEVWEWPRSDPRVTDPPPDELGIWFDEWGQAMREQYPEAAINPGDIHIRVDPAYTGEDVVADPYAYMLFGDNGIAQPVLLIAANANPGRFASIASGELTGMDAAFEAELRNKAGINDLDSLAASWSGLVAETLAVSTTAAETVITKARTAAANMRDTLNAFTGVDDQSQSLLEANGLDSALALANSTVTMLTDMGITRLQAERLLNQARSVVPSNAWSLASNTVQFNTEEVGQLEAAGIHTLSQLQSQANLAQNILGLTEEGQNAINTQINAAQTAYTVAPRTSRSTATLAGIGSVQRGKLAAAGMHNIRSIATSNIGTLTQLFDGNADRARRVSINATATALNIETSVAEALLDANLDINALAAADVATVTHVVDDAGIAANLIGLARAIGR